MGSPESRQLASKMASGSFAEILKTKQPVLKVK
jgi:hypothetical protein